jgi:hypothetical protein
VQNTNTQKKDSSVLVGRGKPFDGKGLELLGGPMAKQLKHSTEELYTYSF